MSTVKLVGWKPGFRKVSNTKIIREYTGYGLAEAKKCTDDILKNKEVIIANLSDQTAKQLLEEVAKIGVVAVIE
jgi:ribosomal protein L7/L12